MPRRLLISMVALAACLQWCLVLQQSWAALWAWYRYVGFGGGGYQALSRNMQVLFLTGSGGAGLVGYFLWRSIPPGSSHGWELAARTGWRSIAVGSLIWIIVLVSPLVRLQE